MNHDNVASAGNVVFVRLAVSIVSFLDDTVDYLPASRWSSWSMP